MTYEEALAAAKEGKMVAADFFGTGWCVVYDAGNDTFWTVNPHTGTHLLHKSPERSLDDERYGKATWSQIKKYEYAGFRYCIRRLDDSDGVQITALEQQHPNAAKHKHVMAALKCFEDDLKAGRIKW